MLGKTDMLHSALKQIAGVAYLLSAGGSDKAQVKLISLEPNAVSQVKHKQDQRKTCIYSLHRTCWMQVSGIRITQRKAAVYTVMQHPCALSTACAA